MQCPDDALLDRWLDDALAPPDEALALGAHLAGCPRCTGRRDARLAEERQWRAALALDAAELAYLAWADLAAAWRARTAPARPAHWWPALVVLGLAGGYAAWLVTLPALQAAVALAGRAGLLASGLAWLLTQAWYAGAAALQALSAPPLVNPTLFAAAVAACLWLIVSRPWESDAPVGPHAETN